MLLQPGSRPVPNAPDYLLIRKRGAGAFGEVWHAHGPGGLDVALKFIHVDSQFRALELRSLDVMKSIRHPNLVSVFGAWLEDNWLILAMELCDRSLHERLMEALDQGLPGIPAEELLGYMSDAAAGLDALNAKPVQHRDVKPANLLLLGSGVKVADFGLAKALEQTVASNTGVGTIAYMAPECFKGQITQQSDQYSLAVTYYVLRTGRLLFKGDQAQVMYAHLEVEPNLSDLPPFERVVLTRALSKIPATRWPSCKVFVNQLTNAYQQAIALERKSKEEARLLYKRGIAWLVKKHGTESNDIDEHRDNAIKDFAEAIRLDPEYAAAYTIRGALLSVKKEYDRAISDFTDAIRLDPKAADGPYRQRGKAWSNKKEYDKAIKDFSEAMRIAPKDAWLFINRGDVWLDKKEYDKAIADYSQAIWLDPSESSHYVSRGDAWSVKKDYVKAINDFDEAIRLGPESANGFGKLAWLLATSPDVKVRDAKRAIRVAMNACELTDWESGLELSILAAAYAEAGRFDEAKRYQMKALEDPDCRGSAGDEFRQRLELYKQKKPFRQRT